MPCGLRAASRARANACVLHCLWINSVSRNVAGAGYGGSRCTLLAGTRSKAGFFRVVPAMYSWRDSAQARLWQLVFIRPSALHCATSN